jgi:imidazolonepropionase
MSVLITNIGELVTNQPERDADLDPGGPGPFAAIAGAALVIDEGRVAWTGPASRAPAADQMVDADGRAVLPGLRR